MSRRSRFLLAAVVPWVVLGIVFAQRPDPDAPKMTPKNKDVKPLEYVEANVPFYPPNGRGGDPLKQMQKPLDPAESMKHLVHPVDFEVKLFAAEPDIGKPICMAWDEKGRLWIAETVDYPNELQQQGRGRDRIRICEDTDGDGKADKFTVFADNLSIPTSMCFSKGGVIVHQAPHTLFLKDTNGDDKADERKTLFTGWSTGDTHAGPSNMVYGHDNWIYGIVGYAGFKGRIGGEQQDFRQGFYRFKPDGSKFEFLRNTNNNSWGVSLSEEGILFGSTANGNPSVYMPIPNRYYEAVRGWSSRQLAGIAGNARMEPITNQVRQVDFHGHFTAAAGHALYTARTYPKQYWNRTAFVNEPTGHLVATFVIEAQGSDFRSRNAYNLLASDDEWTSPIMSEVGPDGCVWVIDWYNFIVQHNPTPRGFKTGKGNAYETELRDKKHGRIYRLVPKEGKPAKPLDLSKAKPEELVATLKNDNLFWRRHAQRLLVEREKKDVVPALIELVNDDKVDDIGLNTTVIHALYTLQGLGALDGSDAKATEAAIKALKHKSAGVRRNALVVLPREQSSLNSTIELLKDPDAQVRLAALLALAEMKSNNEAGAAIAKMLLEEKNNRDRWIPDAATSAAAKHDRGFLTGIATAKDPPTRVLDVVGIVSEHMARGGSGDAIPALVIALEGADKNVAEAIVAGFAKGWTGTTKVAWTDDSDKALTSLMAKLSPAGRGRLVKLSTIWGSKGGAKNREEITRAMLLTLGNEKESETARIDAAKQLIELDPASDAILEKLLEVITPKTSPELAAGIVEAAGNSASKQTGPAILKQLTGWSPAVRASGLRVLLTRKDSVKALLEVMEKEPSLLKELALDQKLMLTESQDKEIRERARKLVESGGGLPNADRQKVVEELVSLTKKKGDATLGKAVFKKNCATCHTHTGEGGSVGPDLTGMAVHPKEELLVQIMDPSRNVEGNYRLYNIATEDGKVLQGLLASETKTSVEIVDAQAKKFVILRSNIEAMNASPKSLMPEGFEKQLKPEEITDLLEFLTQRGKYLPLPLEKVATIVSTKGMFNAADSDVERLILKEWTPKTVKGVPFVLVDPRGDRVPNVILLYGPQGSTAPKMPKSVTLPCNSAAKAIHLLSGVSGWGTPNGERGSVSMIVRLTYADGKTEDHELKNGEHFADYIRKIEVPKSEYAFAMRNQQMRYLSIQPKRNEIIKTIDFVKGSDNSAPIVMAVTVEN